MGFGENTIGLASTLNYIPTIGIIESHETVGKHDRERGYITAVITANLVTGSLGRALCDPFIQFVYITAPETQKLLERGQGMAHLTRRIGRRIGNKLDEERGSQGRRVDRGVPMLVLLWSSQP
jgi:hypothetical protein